MSEELGRLNATWRGGYHLAEIKENETEASLLNFQDLLFLATCTYKVWHYATYATIASPRV